MPALATGQSQRGGLAPAHYLDEIGEQRQSLRLGKACLQNVVPIESGFERRNLLLIENFLGDFVHDDELMLRDAGDKGQSVNMDQVNQYIRISDDIDPGHQMKCSST
jgi:hypothetical protein